VGPLAAQGMMNLLLTQITDAARGIPGDAPFWTASTAIPVGTWCVPSVRGGFMYRRASDEETYELPGLWFSPAELQSLAVMQRILRDLGGGLLADQVSAIAKRLNQLVQHRRLNLGEAAARIRFPGVASRMTGEAFQVAASATLQRRKLWFEYHSRGSNRQSERMVSPQRLTHYREAWYLDAWDEESNELRTFSLDRLRRAKVLEDVAIDLPDARSSISQIAIAETRPSS
jgi:predicted DNA-binding transcriptional regulator YafY